MLSIKQMKEKYKNAKIFPILNGRFIVVDPNSYYCARIKGNKCMRFPEAPTIYDKDGNLFVGNYMTVEAALKTAEGQKQFGFDAFVGEVGPCSIPLSSMFGKDVSSIYPNGAGLYYRVQEKE